MGKPRDLTHASVPTNGISMSWSPLHQRNVSCQRNRENASIRWHEWRFVPTAKMIEPVYESLVSLSSKIPMEFDNTREIVRVVLGIVTSHPRTYWSLHSTPFKLLHQIMLKQSFSELKKQRICTECNKNNNNNNSHSSFLLSNFSACCVPYECREPLLQHRRPPTHTRVGIQNPARGIRIEISSSFPSEKCNFMW